MTFYRHPKAGLEAHRLVAEHDGSAERIIEDRMEQRLRAGDTDDALQLDQVRREVGRIYEPDEE